MSTVHDACTSLVEQLCGRTSALASLGSLQAVARGLCGDVGVGGRLQLLPGAICSGFPRRLGLSGDVAVFPGCDLFGTAQSRPVLDLAGGIEALSQPHNDRRRHLKKSCEFS